MSSVPELVIIYYLQCETNLTINKSVIPTITKLGKFKLWGGDVITANKIITEIPNTQYIKYHHNAAAGLWYFGRCPLTHETRPNISSIKR